MKYYKYKLCSEINEVTQEDPKIKRLFNEVLLEFSEEALETVLKEAYNGEYAIVDDGVEKTVEPTTVERLAALESAMLEMLGVTSNG